MFTSRITSRKSPLVLIACLLLIAGCATGPGQKSREASPDAAARMHLEQGDYGAAAREFLRLAETNPDAAASYRLQAADAWLKSGDADAAGDLLERIQIPPAGEVLVLRRQMLRARIALHRDRPEQALSLLPASPPGADRKGLRADYHAVRAGAFEHRGDIAEAVRERIELQAWLEETDARRHNSLLVWNGLKRLDREQLQLLGRQESSELSAWLELIKIRRQLLSRPAELERAVTEWRRLHQEHPAVPEITDEILATGRDLLVRPGSIALLLPFSGPYKRAAEAIRDGLLAAWYADEDFQPDIRIYDTDSVTILEDYQKAVGEGAEFIIGPLEKSAIRTLLDDGRITTTTLALNQIDGGEAGTGRSGIMESAETGKLFQYALSPEHEVRQIVHRGIFEGFNRTLVITPDNQWGERLSSVFKSEWRDMGGTLLESVQYDPNSQDFISPVKELLNIDSSEERISRLRQRLSRNIKADSRTREDTDFIYMAATPVNARQIVPQFRFFRVDRIPIYSTSHVYSGTPDPQLDADMNRVEFTDIPWVLRTNEQRPSIQKGIEENWSSRYSAYRRLYAFGVDAYRIIPHLGRLSELDHYRYQGETGELGMTDSGYLQRQLLWARFVNGRPVPLDMGDHLERDRDSTSQR